MSVPPHAVPTLPESTPTHPNTRRVYPTPSDVLDRQLRDTPARPRQNVPDSSAGRLDRHARWRAVPDCVDLRQSAPVPQTIARLRSISPAMSPNSLSRNRHAGVEMRLEYAVQAPHA